MLLKVVFFAFCMIRGILMKITTKSPGKMVPKKSQFSPKGLTFVYVVLVGGRSRIPNPVLVRLLMGFEMIRIVTGLQVHLSSESSLTKNSSRGYEFYNRHCLIDPEWWESIAVKHLHCKGKEIQKCRFKSLKTLEEIQKSRIKPFAKCRNYLLKAWERGGAKGFRRKRRRSWLKSHSTIHKCPQLLAQPQIHFHKWPKLLQLIFTVKCREKSTELPRSRKQFLPKHIITHSRSKKEKKNSHTSRHAIRGGHLIICHLVSASLNSFQLNDSISQLPPLH